MYIFTILFFRFFIGDSSPLSGHWIESVPDWVVRTPDWSCLADWVQGFARLAGPVRPMPNHDYIKKTILPDLSNFPIARLCVVVCTPDCQAPDCLPDSIQWPGPGPGMASLRFCNKTFQVRPVVPDCLVARLVRCNPLAGCLVPQLPNMLFPVVRLRSPAPRIETLQIQC